MNFTHYDLGNLDKGRVIEITLQGNAANVQLLDSANFVNYKNGRQYQFIGGLAKQSPIRLQTPHASHWHIAIDLRGMMGNIHSTVQVMPVQPLAANQKPSSSLLSSIPGSNVLPVCGSDEESNFDLFVLHATEDNGSIVRPLAEALTGKNISVWYNKFELHVGDSLRQKIQEGFAGSKLGIAVISRDFIKKGWTDDELESLMAHALGGGQRLLPVWHNITKQEMIDFNPALAENATRNTAVNTIAEMADEIEQIVQRR